MKQLFYETKLFLRKKRVFLKIFFLLLLLSIFSMVAVVFFINSVIVREQNSYIEEMRENQLVQASELVDLRIDELEKNMTQFLQNSDVVAVMVNPQNQDSELHHRILQMLTRHSQDYDFLLQAFIYLPYAGEVYHSNGDFLPLDSVDEADIIRSYVDQRENTVHLDDIRQDVFRWQDRVFLVADYCVPNFIGALFFELDTEFLYNLIQNGSSHSEVLVMDEEDTWLFHEPDESVDKEWRNGGYISYISEKMGWRYLCSAETDYAAPGLSYVFSMVLPFIIGYLLLSLLITVRITYNVYRPIGRLLAIATRDGNQDPMADHNYRNEMDYLELAYSDTLEKNQDQKELLASISNDILEQLFRNIVSGTVTNMSAVGRTLRGLDRTDLQQKRYLVMVVSFSNAEGGEPSILENSLYQRSLRNVAESWKNEECQSWSLLLEETVMSIVLSFPESCNDGKILMYAAELGEHIYQSTKDFPYRIKVGKGRIYGEMIGLRYSWQEAMDDIRYQSIQTEHAVEEENPVQMENQKQYYSEKGVQVADIAERRTAKEAMEVGSMLLAEIGGVPAQNQMVYFQTLLQPVRERLTSYGIPEETIRETEAADGEEKMSSLNSQETRRQYMTDVYSRLLKLLQSSSQNKKYRYVKAAQDYISENYQNGSLSLNEASDAIGISSAYLSEVFSEVTKSGFTVYLNRYRVERAKEFLVKMSAPTGEIGELCGFNSAQNFTRVFKKYAGVTPGQYRDELRRRAEDE